MSWVAIFRAFVLASLVFAVSTGDPKAITELQANMTFIEIGEGLYLIEGQEEVSWYEALAICRRHNAELVSIETAAEMHALSAYLTKEKFSNYFWTSGSDLHREGAFVWMGTGQPFGYTNFYQGQPDNHKGTEHCVHFNQFRTWNDLPCLNTHPYICEGKNEPSKYQFRFEFN